MQVALPHYVEPWFIRRAVCRYRQFLYLKLLFKKEFISPPYDLDLLWHLHMVCHTSTLQSQQSAYLNILQGAWATQTRQISSSYASKVTARQ